VLVSSVLVVIFLVKNKTIKKEFKTLQQELNAFKQKKLNDQNSSVLINLKSKAVLSSGEILYIKSDGHYVEYHLKNKAKPEIDRNTLKEVMNMLPAETFVRIHKSFIVNIYHIRIMNSTKLMLNNGVWINLSRTYKQELKDILHK
jgi:DNA-binding LytR/AlgR family response regulator